MRIFNYFLTAILATATIASCTEPGAGTMEPITLVASSQTIEGNGVDIVTFSVLSGEIDVTAEAKVFKASDNSELVNKSFSTNIPGDYEFYATYSGMASDNVKVTALGDITLTPDKADIEADGTDAVTFTVTQDGADVTAECELYLIGSNGEEILQEGMTFSTTKSGKHSLFVKKGTSLSQTIQITAWFCQDDDPLNTNFYERAVLGEFTGTWCGFCPMIKATVRQLEEEGWDKGIVAEIHYNDMLEIDAYPYIYAYFVGSGYPTVIYNFDKKTYTANYGNLSTNKSYMKTYTDNAINAYPCSVGIAANFRPTSGNELKIDAFFKFSEGGEYKLAAWLVEDNIFATQSNYAPQVVSSEIANNHMHVLRAVNNDSDPLGELVTVNGSEMVEKTFTFNISDLLKGEPENCHIIVFANKLESNGNYITNNAIDCYYNNSVGLEYNE